MQSFSNSNGSQSQNQFSFDAKSEFQKLASSGLSEQLSLLKDKFQYPDPQFVFLLDRVTSQFLTDEKNQIKQNDFSNMVSILCDHLDIMLYKIKSLSCNSQRPDLNPRMDMATAYHYENYRTILQRYIDQYARNDIENVVRIRELLLLLDEMFQTATEQSDTVTNAEDSEYEKTFTRGTSRRTAITHELLPQNSLADNKSDSFGGTRVTDEEIEHNLRPIPAKYQNVRSSLADFPGLYIGDNTINAKQPHAASSRRAYIDFKGQRRIMRCEEVDNLPQQLDIDRVDESILMDIKQLSLAKEISSLNQGIESIIQMLKEKRTIEEKGQQFIQAIPLRLLQLQAHISSLNDKYKSAAEGHSFSSAIKAYPSLAELVNEVLEIEKLNKKLIVRLSKPKKEQSKLSSLLQAEKPRKTKSLSKAEEELDEMESSEEEYLPTKKSRRQQIKQPRENKTSEAMVLEEIGIPKEVKDTIEKVTGITQEQLATLKKFLGRKGKDMISNDYETDSDIVDPKRIGEVYKIIYDDKNAKRQGLYLLVPEVWETNSRDDFQQEATPRKQPSRKLKFELQVVPQEGSNVTIYPIPLPSPTFSDSSSRQSNLMSPATLPGLSPELNPSAAQSPKGSVSRKRSRAIAANVEESKAEGASPESKMEITLSNNVLKITRDQFQALSELFNFSKMSLLTEAIESTRRCTIAWNKGKKDSDWVINDKKAIDKIYSYIASKNPAYNTYPSNWVDLNKQKKRQQDSDQGQPAKRLKQESSTQPQQPDLRLVLKKAQISGYNLSNQQPGMTRQTPMSQPQQQGYMPLQMPMGQPQQNNMPVQMSMDQPQQQGYMPLPMAMGQPQQQGYMPLPMAMGQPLQQANMPPQMQATQPSRFNFFQPAEPQNGVSTPMPNQHSPMQIQHQLGFFSQTPFGLGNNGADPMLPTDDPFAPSQFAPSIGTLLPLSEDDFTKSFLL